MVLNVLLAIIETCVFFAIGGAALKIGYIGRDDIPRWSRFTFDVFTPCLTFAAIAGNIDRSELAQLWIMPVAGFAIMAAGALLGIVFLPLLRCRTDERKATFVHLCAINNYIFLPLIVVGNLFGFGRHAALLMVANVGSTVGFWTIGVITLTGVRRDTFKTAMKQVFSVNVVAVALALAVVLWRIPVPRPVMKTVGTLGALAVPLTLILTGAALFRDARGLWLHKADAGIVIVTRLILIPAVYVGILKLLPLPRDMYEVCFVIALMPAAVSSALVARLYGGDGDFASQSVVTTTLLAMVSVPLWIKLL